jgi:hypothetical protein
VWDLLAHEALRAAVEVAERVADGAATAEELGVAGRAAWAVVKSGRRKARGGSPSAAQYAAEAAAWAAARHAREAVGEAESCAHAVRVEQKGLSGPAAYMKRSDCPWAADIYPFEKRTALPPAEAAWLEWNAGTVRILATSIYAERAFDRMPVLAEALEDAGCANRDILIHCRRSGPHWRGCWVIDLLLGKVGERI